MAGGLIQLLSQGSQDAFLTGNPQITFFRGVYRRHTNFSMQSIQHLPNTSSGLNKRTVFTISRTGDLIGRTYLQFDLTHNLDLASPRLGHQIIDYVDIIIGGNRIDRQYGDWMDIWAQLSSNSESWKKLNNIVNGSLRSSDDNPRIYIPLQFWFCNNPALALPIKSLQFHSIKIEVKFNKLVNIFDINGNPIKSTNADGSVNSIDIKNVALWCDHIFLDAAERRIFSEYNHEYLIEQIQFSGVEKVNFGPNRIRLNFNHPVKELIWSLKNAKFKSPFNYFNSNGSDGKDPANKLCNADMAKSVRLLLCGNDRFDEREGSYFRCVQPFQHHSGGHQQSDGNAGDITAPGEKSVDALGGFYCYSFALKPEEHQPSGTCNFSRIDVSTLNIDANDNGDLKVYAISYNLLRIINGMCCLAFSN